MGFYAFCGVVLIGAAIMTWPGPALRWCGLITTGSAIFATIMLWAIILDPGPHRKTPPLGVAMLGGTNVWTEAN